MATSHVGYCQVADVLARMYGGQGGAAYGQDANRDALIGGLIQAASRRFEQLTGRPLNGFAPIFEPRKFSGRGSMTLEVDEFVALYQVQIDSNPAGIASYTDVTSDFIAVPGGAAWTGLGRVEPVRYYPKDRLLRQSTFYVDPYQWGNVVVTALWGAVVPDLAAAEPAGTGSPPTFFPPYNISQTRLNALQPVDALGTNIGGWWVTPEDVIDVIARWTVFMLKASQAGYADALGSTATATQLFSKQTPQFVQDVVENYNEKELHLAMITPDGVDIAESLVWGEVNTSGDPMQVSRWAGWQTQT